jgi:hypothetical protein
MRSITIDFTKSPIEISEAVLGHKGEKNATQLIIKPPTEMSAPDSGIVYYCVAFQIGAHRVSHSALYEKAETITVPLERSVTQVNVLSLQLEGYDGEENVIIKSDRVDNLTFDVSVDGEEYDGNSGSRNLGAEVAAMQNKLNQFGEDKNGNLLYKGNPITAGRPTREVTLSGKNGEYYCATLDTTYLIVDTTYSFANGTEIKSIEILYDGKWINIYDIARYDGYATVINMFAVSEEVEFVVGESVLAIISPLHTAGFLTSLLAGPETDIKDTVYEET